MNKDVIVMIIRIVFLSTGVYLVAGGVANGTLWQSAVGGGCLGAFIASIPRSRR